MSEPTNDEAREIAQRFIDGHFGFIGAGPRCSIPARTGDDDLRLVEYIGRAKRIESEHAAMLALLRRCVNTWGVPLDQSVGDVGDPTVPLGVPFTDAEHTELSALLMRIDGKDGG